MPALRAFLGFAFFVSGVQTFLSTVSADERTRGAVTADEFPDLNLPRLSDDRPLSPGIDERRSRSRAMPPEESRRRTVPPDESVPLDPVEPVLPERSLRDRRRETSGKSAGPDSILVPRKTDSAVGVPQNAAKEEGFDWTMQPVSIADIGIGAEWQFQFEHGKANLTEIESEAYVELIRAVEYRRQTPMRFPESVNVTSLWESSFYRFAETRRQAWLNGMLKLEMRSGRPADPFSTGTEVVSAADVEYRAVRPKEYSLQLDMKSHPADFVGRPVVVYGLFKPFGEAELRAKRTLEGEENVYRLQRGYLWNLQDTEAIAIVDAISYVDPESQNTPSQAWRGEGRVSIPVMVKGWFVKLWQKQPLLYTDVVRVLTPRPYDHYIRDHVASKVRVRDDESWIYHETLRQMQVTRGDYHAAIALQEQQKRVAELLQDVREKAASEKLALEEQLRNGAISKVTAGQTLGFDDRIQRVERQLQVRESRYKKYQQEPDSFPMFVEVFQNPGRWQGRLVTLRGHVRRVSTYPGDATLFDGQPLHELWLFTDDSQHNPAVVITPTLPPNFPVTAEVVDSVSVTGCFFKMYVYRSQSENRLAPLLLTGSVTWTPTDDQVLSLASAGHVSKATELFRTAQSQNRKVSDTMILVLGFLVLLMAMTAWGKVQRDRREHRRLMGLVDERPDFRQTSQDLYSGPFADPRIESSRG